MDPSRFAHRSLEDFERLCVGVGPENYGWYQVKLHVGAKRIYDSGGIDALSRMWRTFALGPDLLSSILETEVDPEGRATPCASGFARSRPRTRRTPRSRPTPGHFVFRLHYVAP